jgi:Lon protease-like protein
MVADALDGDRMIGMTLLKPGFEHDYDGRPPVYPIGCAGVITHAERLDRRPLQHHPAGHRTIPDRGRRPDARYWVATVEPMSEPSVLDVISLQSLRQRLEALVLAMAERAGGEWSMPAAMGDADLVHALAQYLDFEPIEKQALLEVNGLVARATALADLLEMKSLRIGTAVSGGRH